DSSGEKSQELTIADPSDSRDSCQPGLNFGRIHSGLDGHALQRIDAPAVGEAGADLDSLHAPRSRLTRARLAVAETEHEITAARHNGGFEALHVEAKIVVAEYMEEAA